LPGRRPHVTQTGHLALLQLGTKFLER
jgi:hypothetical protein